MNSDGQLLTWVHDHLTYPHDYCLLWPFGRTRQGYGGFKRGGKYIYAHRYICELVHGPAPTEGHQAAHSCGRGHDGCVNPRHLSWKTPSENQHDRTDVRQGRRKLTPEQVAEIRSLKDTLPVSDIAERFGCTEANVRQIHSGKTWRKDRDDYRTFTEAEIHDIRARAGTNKSIATVYGVRPAVIRRIRLGLSYKHVPQQMAGAA